MAGLNIFTHSTDSMKYLILLCFSFLSFVMNAQVSIEADDTSGCYPFTVSFNIQPVSARDTITSVSWDFGNSKTSTEISPVTIYDTSGVYSVSCLINGVFPLVRSNMIFVGSDCLDVPNVFTPNEDGINDFFEVKTNGVSVYTFEIYTRSGTLIYKTESPAILWDGRSLSGQRMKNGIYFYIIRQSGTDSLNEAKGIVYLYD